MNYKYVRFNKFFRIASVVLLLLQNLLTASGLSAAYDGSADLPPTVAEQLTAAMQAASESAAPVAQSAESPSDPVPPLESLLPALSPIENARSSIMAAPAACTPRGALQAKLTLPDYVISAGNQFAPTPGDSYHYRIRNNGTVTTTEVSFRVTPSAGFSLTAAENITSTVDGGLTASIVDNGNGTFDIVLQGGSPLDALGPGEQIEFDFTLVTDSTVASGQPLKVDILSGTPTPTSCKSVTENVPVGRGNLIVQKTPAIQEGDYGDTITWTVSVGNSGLGEVYNTVLTDTIGVGYIPSLPTFAPIPVLAPNETIEYTVAGQINSCTDLTNAIAAAWSVGNEDGTGTSANPVQDFADVIYQLNDPIINITVGDLPVSGYCGSLIGANLRITVTNTGGPARDLALNISGIENANVSFLSSADWSGTFPNLTYTGDALDTDESVVLYLEINGNGTICSEINANFTVTPTYSDACRLGTSTTPVLDVSSPLGEDAPSINLSKVGPEEAQPGDIVEYVVTVSAENIDNSNGIILTDTVPASLINVSALASGGTVTVTGNIVEWTTDNSSATVNETITIQAEVPTTESCGAGGSLINRVVATVPTVCLDCLVQDTAESITYIIDPLGDNSFDVTIDEIELCSLDSGDQQISASAVISNGIDFNGSYYRNNLGADQFSGGNALDVVPGSVSVFINDINRTEDVSVTLAPEFEVDFSPLNLTVPAGTETKIAINFAVTGDDDLLSSASLQNMYYLFSEMVINGSSAESCGGGFTAYSGDFITLFRGDLNISHNPSTILSCQENTIELTVDSATVRGVTNQLVITHTAAIGDIITPTAATFSGSLSGLSIGVGVNDVQLTQNGPESVFTFPANFDPDGAGTIRFPLYRPCGITDVLNATLEFGSSCSAVSTKSDEAGGTTQTSNVVLFASPTQYTIANRDAAWRFNIKNVGTAPASEINITDELPAGYQFKDVIITTQTPGLAPFLSTISTSTAMSGGIETLYITIPEGLPIDSNIQFDVTSNILGCNLPDSTTITLSQTCGLVGGGVGVCQGTDSATINFIKAPGSMTTSNVQEANLPLCEVGTIKVVQKNTSAAAFLYDHVIRENLNEVTYRPGTATVTVTDVDNNVIFTGPFTPNTIQITATAS